MAIRGLPRPLPECKRCGDPVKRQRWTVTGGYCTGCMTTPEVLAAKHRETHMARLAADSTTVSRRVDARIDELAARRQARAAR